MLLLHSLGAVGRTGVAAGKAAVELVPLNTGETGDADVAVDVGQGTSALQSCNSWKAGAIPGTPS